MSLRVMKIMEFGENNGSVAADSVSTVETCASLDNLLIPSSLRTQSIDRNEVDLPKGSYSTCENPSDFGPDIRVEVVVRSQFDTSRGGVSLDNSELQKCMKRAFVEPQEQASDGSPPYCDAVVSTLENVATFIWQRMESLLPDGTLYEVMVSDSKNVVCYRG
ncbi:6-pyruvoyl tetrahydrobiopterin synthase-like [Ptychodera flava]|uniref:6-pyruvoyl tetrahydrobiopterin synthase-like n=1 Tax=Ptychodera flava TaxID=63121 RepID=UPI00396A1AE8